MDIAFGASNGDIEIALENGHLNLTSTYMLHDLNNDTLKGKK